MKIFNITDWHLNSESPVGRKDDFKQHQLNQLNEIKDIVNDNNVDYLLINGDLFDKPRIYLPFFIEIMEIFKQYNCQILVTAGNHDLWKEGVLGLNKTFLRVLGEVDNVTLLINEKAVYSEYEGSTIAIQGKAYHKNIDENIDSYMYTGDDVDYSIISVHGNLMDKEAIFDDYTLIQNIQTNANIVTAGHYHPGFNNIITDDKAIINPKSLVRRKRTTYSKNRIPSGLMIELFVNDNKVTHSIDEIQLTESYKPYEELFNEGEIVEYDTTVEELNDFTNDISNVEDLTIDSFVTHDTLIKSMGDKFEDVDSNVVNKAIDMVKENTDDSLAEDGLEGYATTNESVTIDKLIMENFKCYDNQTITFDKGVNVLIGRSGQGKSTALKAIDYCLEDEGSANVVTTGETRATVTIEFSNGYSLTRTRTKTKASDCWLITPDGQKKNSPSQIEIYNVTQMPRVNLYGNGLEPVLTAGQHDTHFLISQNGGEIAKAIGNIANSQPIDKSISDAKLQISRGSREVNSIKTDIDEIDEQLEQYDKLDDVAKLISEAESIKSKIENIKESNSEMSKILSKYTALNIHINGLQNEINRYPNMSKIKSDHSKLNNEIDKLQNELILNNEYEDCIVDINTISDKIDKLELGTKNIYRLYNELNEELNYQIEDTKLLQDMCGSLDDIIKYKSDISKLKYVEQADIGYNRLAEQVNTLERPIALYNDLIHSQAKYERLKNIIGKMPEVDKEIIEKVEGEIDRIAKLKNTLTNYDESVKVLNDSIDKVEEQEGKVNNVQDEYDNVKSEYNALIEENDICPLCGTENLDEECIMNILKGE